MSLFCPSSAIQANGYSPAADDAFDDASDTMVPSHMVPPKRRSHLGQSGDGSGKLSLRERPPSMRGSIVVRPSATASPGGTGVERQGVLDA